MKSLRINLGATYMMAAWILFTSVDAVAQSDVTRPDSSPKVGSFILHFGRDPKPNPEVQDHMLRANQALYVGDLGTAEAEASAALKAVRETNGEPNVRMDSVDVILGEVRLQQRKPREALNLLLPTTVGTRSSTAYHSDRRDINLVIAYCRMGDYRNARLGYDYVADHHYHPILREFENPDIPGSANVRQIEASMFLERAIRFSGFLPKHGEDDLRAAEKLLPTNAMVAFELGKVLRDNAKYAEANSRFNKACVRGHGKLADDAKKESENVANTLKCVQAHAGTNKDADPALTPKR